MYVVLTESMLLTAEPPPIVSTSIAGIAKLLFPVGTNGGQLSDITASKSPFLRWKFVSWSFLSSQKPV